MDSYIINSLHAEKYCAELQVSFWSIGYLSNRLYSIAYLQKQLHIFILFQLFWQLRIMSAIFSCYCMEPWEICLHIYSLSLSAFLEYQTNGFNSEENHVPLLTFGSQIHFASSLSLLIQEKLDWDQYFIHKTEIKLCARLVT